MTRRIARWWFAVCVLALIVGSDYEFRTRDPDAALGGGIDSAIMVELLLYGAVGAYLSFAHFRLHRVARVRPQIYLAVSFVGLMALSLTYTPYVEYALVRVVQMSIVVALVVAGSTHGTREHFHRFAHGFLVLVVASVFYGLVVPSPPVSGLQEGRFTWLAIHPTVSGVLAGLAVLVALAYLPGSGSSSRLWPPTAYVGALVVVAGALLASQTRGAIIGTAVGVAIILISSRSGRAVIEAALAAALVLGAVALSAAETVTEYFTRGESPEQLATLNSRTRLWESAIDKFFEEPLYGHGVTATQGIFYEETGLGGGHNAYINLLVELGIVGLACWVALVAVLIVGIRRLPRTGDRAAATDRSLLLAVVGFLLVNGVSYEGAGATTNVASTWLLVVVGWLTVAQRPSPEPATARSGAVAAPALLRSPR